MTLRQGERCRVGTLILLGSVERACEVEREVKVVRSNLERLRIVCRRLRIVLLIVPCRPPYHVGSREKRVALDAQRRVPLGTRIVTQHKLRKSSVVVRLSHCGRHLNYLVKVLDGDHEILEANRIAPDRHHPLRIYLRPKRSTPHAEHAEEQRE